MGGSSVERNGVSLNWLAAIVKILDAGDLPSVARFDTCN